MRSIKYMMNSLALKKFLKFAYNYKLTHCNTSSFASFSKYFGYVTWYRFYNIFQLLQWQLVHADCIAMFKFFFWYWRSLQYVVRTFALQRFSIG